MIDRNDIENCDSVKTRIAENFKLNSDYEFTDCDGNKFSIVDNSVIKINGKMRFDGRTKTRIKHA